MSRTTFALTLALSLLVIAGCNDQPGQHAQQLPMEQVAEAAETASAEEPFEPPVLHEGRVHVYDIARRPVEGATVWRMDLYAYGGWLVRPSAEYATDAEGRTPDATAYSLSRYVAHKPGFALGSMESQLPPGADPVIILPPPSDRRVRVVDGGGRPIAGTRLFPWAAGGYLPTAVSEALSLETDEAGYATLSLSSDLCPPIAYYVMAPGFACEQYREESPRVTLEPAGKVVVRVRGGEPEDFAGWIVHAAGPPQTFDGRRKLTFPNVKPGETRVFVGPSATDASHPAQLALDVDIAAGKVTEFVVGAVRAWPVTGRVLGEDGAPIAGTAVSVSSEHRAAVPRFVTDEQGRYALHLTPGEYELAPGAVPPYVAGPHDRVRLTVEAGTQTVVPDITMSRGITLSGRVIDEAGEPVEGAEVLNLGTPGDAGLAGLGSFSRPIAISGPDGEFSVESLPKRTSALVARTDSAISAMPVLVDPTARVAVGLPIRDDAAAWIEGRISLPDGRPATRVEVEFRLYSINAWTGLSADERRANGIPPFSPLVSGRSRVDADGRYRVGPLLPGGYDIWAQAGAPGEALSSEQIDLERAQTVEVDFTVPPDAVAMWD